MKRFVLYNEVYYPDAENGPEFDVRGLEPIADFDTLEEAQQYAEYKMLRSFEIEDTDLVAGLELFDDEDANSQYYRDNDDSDYDLDDDEHDRRDLFDDDYGND